MRFLVKKPTSSSWFLTVFGDRSVTSSLCWEASRRA